MVLAKAEKQVPGLEQKEAVRIFYENYLKNSVGVFLNPIFIEKEIQERAKDIKDLKDIPRPKTLSSCTGEGGCPLSDAPELADPLAKLNVSTYPNRSFFKKHFLEHVTQNFSAKDKVMTYVSIGSGGLKMDFELLELLYTAGYKNFRICLIDFGYAKICDGLKKEIPLDKIDEGKNKHLKQIEEFTMWFLVQKNINAQIFLFPTVKAYVTDCSSSNGILEADIITAVDTKTEDLTNTLIKQTLKDTGFFYILDASRYEFDNFLAWMIIGNKVMARVYEHNLGGGYGQKEEPSWKELEKPITSDQYKKYKKSEKNEKGQD